MTTLPPSPGPAEKQEGPTAFPPPTGAQILTALRAPAIGYAWLLLGAVAIMILIVLAANVGSTGDDTGVDSDDTNAIGVVIGMPFQIAAMALLGSLHFTEDGVSASLFLPPLLLTGLYVLMTARAARRGDVVPVAGTRAVLGVIVGFASAIVVTLVTWLLAMRADGTALHAASVSLFFGVWLLTAAASYAGMSRTAGATRPDWISSDYASAGRLWAGSVAVWLVVAGVVVTVVAAVKAGLWVAILAPVWGVTVGLYTYSLGHLGSLSFAGEVVSVGDFSAVWTVLMVVGALALAVLTSIAWHLRRDTHAVTLAQPGSWVVLPVTYGVGSLLVWLVPTIALGGGMGAFGGSATLQPAVWIVFLLIVWGVAVEAASRFVAPALVPVLPERLRTALRGPEPVETTPPGQPVTAAEARPLTREERARFKLIALLSGAMIAVVLAGWIAISVINSQFHGPEDQAEAYLDAVVDGDLDQVIELAPTSSEADDSLLTSDIYQAADARITGYEIGEVEKDGDSVTVEVEVELEGLDGTANAELVLHKDGHTGVFFDKWRVAGGGLAKMVAVYLPESAGDLSVNGEAVDAFDENVWLLPGTYDIDAFAGNQWMDSSGEPFTVVAHEDYQYVDVPGAVASEAFREEVQSQIDDYLADCMASTELEPANCPNSGYGFYDVRNVAWTLDQAPTPDFDSFDGTFPADLSYGEGGRATVTYEEDQSYGFGPKDWQPQTEESDIYLSSVIVTEEGGSLVVTVSD